MIKSSTQKLLQKLSKYQLRYEFITNSIKQNSVIICINCNTLKRAKQLYEERKEGYKLNIYKDLEILKLE